MRCAYPGYELDANLLAKPNIRPASGHCSDAGHRVRLRMRYAQRGKERHVFLQHVAFDEVADQEIHQLPQRYPLAATALRQLLCLLQQFGMPLPV